MFELVVLFSGLCFFSDQQETVYLVNAVGGTGNEVICQEKPRIPSHLPRLAFMVGQLEPESDVEDELEYAVDIDGRVIATLPLARRNICFRVGTAPCSCAPGSATWADNPNGSGQAPTNPGQELGGRWIGKLSEVDGDASGKQLKGDVTDLASFAEAISRVVVSGELRSRRIAKKKNNQGKLVPIVWQKGGVNYKALAGDVTIAKKYSQEVRVHDCTEGKDLFRIPVVPGSTVTVGISNLPRKLTAQPTKLQHYLLFYDLLDWGSTGCPSVTVPTTTDPIHSIGVMGGNVFCPPARQ